VTAFTKGIFVSLLAGACIFISIKTYKWGNCRWRPKRIPFRQRLVVLQGGIRRTCRTCCAVPAAALSTCHRHLQGDPLNRPRETPSSSAVHSEGSVHSEELVHREEPVHSEVRGAPQSSSAGGASVSELTELGWLLLTVGCVICPGFNLLAICLCRRRKRADLGDGDLGDGDLAADLGAGIGADLGAGESTDGSEVAVAASPEVATMERDATEREVASSPAVNAPQRHFKISLPTSTGKGGVMDNIYLAALRASRNDEYKRGWIGDREHTARLVTVWVAHFAVEAVMFLLCITYGAKFGENATAQMLANWGMSYALQLVVIQPVQVLLLACAPCLFNEDHMVGRCLSRLRFVYNEYC